MGAAVGARPGSPPCGGEMGGAGMRIPRPGRAARAARKRRDRPAAARSDRARGRRRGPARGGDERSQPGWGPPLRRMHCPACRAGRRAALQTGLDTAAAMLQEGESRIFTCWAPRPAPGATLAWYLNGERQEINLSTADTASVLTLTGQRSDHQLNCSLTLPTSSETYNTSILLNVQYNPEALREGAHHQQAEGAGLLLVLFVLVQANPPASTTWVDQDGHVMANTSKFLLLGTTSYPGLANHSLHIHLSCTAGNLSISAANSVAITTASLLPTGLLDARVELPVLGVAVGAALALSALLSLGSCAACLACRLPKLARGPGQAGGNSLPSQCSHCSSSEPPQPQGTRLPRQTQSLPPNLRLSDLAQEDGASPKDAGASARGEERALLGLENSLVLSRLGKGSRWASSPERCVVGHGAPWLPQQAMSSLSCRFCPAPNVWAHLQSAQHEQ
ncbi:transmembrane protein 25 isoform X1 [Passer montanus]|uniref:transmembrane protein 25 isoform X1 n=1 Tax=Passer montanus TaxID=9160 RepID=UPI00196047C2|nr:transmembrane protein 25 isoform X1 [Passer montanus]